MFITLRYQIILGIYIDLKPIDITLDHVWMAFEVPFLYRPTHFVNHKNTAVLCNYASAGTYIRKQSLGMVPQLCYE